jgi:hypothetical protein
VQLDGSAKIPSSLLPTAAVTTSTALAGDVTGTTGATVVSAVGAKTAAQVAQSVTDTLAATAANTVSTLVKRDGSGNVAVSTITSPIVYGSASASGSITVDSTSNGAKGNVLLAPSGGKVGIGTGASSVSARLEVAGAAVARPNIIATGATVDLSLANTHLLKSVGGSTITLQNIVSGGSYLLLISDTTSRTYTFTGCNNTYFNPTNGATSNRSSYSIVAVLDGASVECYISWMTGFN